MRLRHDFEMLPLRAFRPECGRMRLYSSKSPPAPDYRPVAEASTASAEIMGKLGQDQLAFAKLQYEENKPVFQSIVDQQKTIADQTAAQGADYYSYLKSYRPTERAMMYESLGLTPDEQGTLENTLATGDQATFDARLSSLGVGAAKRRTEELDAAKTLDQTDAAVIGGSDADVYAARKAQIDQSVGTAIADTEEGYTRSVNQAIRQGLRYGASTPAMTSTVGAQAMDQASRIAGAANAARTVGINTERGIASTRMGLRSAITDNMTRARSIDWAKKLDATGLVKGLPGASQGAYGLAVNSGNSAGQNQQAPGAQMQAGLQAGANTIGQGQQMRINGLSNVLNAQSSAYANAPEDQTGAIVGAVGGIAAAAMMSDRRLKRNVVRIGRRADTLAIYAYEYVWGGGLQIGVMADEVAQIYPDAVIRTASGYDAVDYAAI